ncbi:hypothetical protein SDRG_00665 [Saprolegnia diclina VS20]|uniref:Uncharacterized protein n=1 Tax=Saprolegnia diclina (strain VS20) TaxID=1156394 RepID=T0R5V3_SAPDV|nr:hypothetical protein SDRG_00665 [Saprolegnia diclina VS20]EQC41805.1 hypothetical protein SDRG_00665 [Saprolegnia diclina VS20]|eukprot:XP_008604374.1 hypothetical protein SDRG_00665 [Saprolegnia diclina VS20]
MDDERRRDDVPDDRGARAPDGHGARVPDGNGTRVPGEPAPQSSPAADDHYRIRISSIEGSSDSSLGSRRSLPRISANSDKSSLCGSFIKPTTPLSPDEAQLWSLHDDEHDLPMMELTRPRSPSPPPPPVPRRHTDARPPTGMAASAHPTGTMSAARLFMMPRRSEPQLPLHMNPPRLRAATTTAYRSLPPHLEEPRLRLAPLKRTSGLKPPTALDDDDDVPPELVEHMFAITPPSTPAQDDDDVDDFRRTISPIAVIEPAASRQLTLLESLMSLAHRLGVFIFIDMTVKLIMFLVFMSYEDPLRMIISIFGYSIVFNFSPKQYFVFATLCTIDSLLIVYLWNNNPEKDAYRKVLSGLDIAVIMIELMFTMRLLAITHRLSEEELQQLHER